MRQYVSQFPQDQLLIPFDVIPAIGLSVFNKEAIVDVTNALLALVDEKQLDSVQVVYDDKDRLLHFNFPSRNLGSIDRVWDLAEESGEVYPQFQMYFVRPEFQDVDAILDAIEAL